MTRAFPVIGSSWGDECKGAIADYLCAREDARMVVRFNGGAQAGHTVVTPKGRRHVFHHFGAGTLYGAQTYLSEDFICNPILFCQELEILKDCNPLVSVDQRCYVTTPYDMIINQMLERKRGLLRHGSCGLGINETIVRCEAYEKLTVGQLSDKVKRREIFDRIRFISTPARMQSLGLEPDSTFAMLIKSEKLASDFDSAVDVFLANTYIAGPELLASFKTIVFEGAQGLALDQNNTRDFPYLTHSNTGLQNVVKLCEAARVTELFPHYVTRCYSTRHGAGPFPGEIAGLPYIDIEDDTNVTGQYQGALRFAPLHIESLSERIKKDISFASRMEGEVTLAVTCLDQMGVTFKHCTGGAMYSVPLHRCEVAEFIRYRAGLRAKTIWSEGKTRDNVKGFEHER
jgi:adenylosuccinate synthase